jgi:hypothetical protein
MISFLRARPRFLPPLLHLGDAALAKPVVLSFGSGYSPGNPGFR